MGLAAHFPEDIRGLVVEGGSASIGRMIQRWNLDSETAPIRHLLNLHQEKSGSISLPMLVIHGERDELIPVEAAADLCEAFGSQDITFDIIPGAGHNDLLRMDMEVYFSAAQRFISSHNKM